MFDLTQIKIIVGLGNIGDEYSKTRHNAGFLFLDSLYQGPWKENKEKHYLEAEWDGIKLIKPTTMMNLSGRAVQNALAFYKFTPAQLVVAHDDMDIDLGKYKLQLGTGPKIHNGLSSIDQFLSTTEYWHLRIGIENREVRGNKGTPGMAYALENFKIQEREQLQETFANIVVEIL